MTFAFEPNGTDVNAVDADGTLGLVFTIIPATLLSAVLFSQLTLIGGRPAGGEGPIIFYVPPDVLDAPFMVPPNTMVFTLPAPGA